MDLNLDKKIIVLAGGSGAIGLDACKLLLEEGSILIIIDKEKPLIKEKTKNLFFYQSKLSNEKSIKHVFNKILKKFKSIDVLINSIGVFSNKNILSLSEKEIINIFHTNFVITSILTKYFLKLMIKKRSGKIINIGSIAGQNGGIFAGDLYSVTKAALINFTKSIAKKYGKFNIYCNCINPGPLESKMTKNWPTKVRNNLIKGFNIKNEKKLGDTKEIANIILFLASEKSRLIQGSEINANGGINI
jgi:3-oxoacyl-[acyl-carrier protein] reductase